MKLVSLTLGGTGANNALNARETLGLGVNASLFTKNVSSNAIMVGNPTGGWKGNGALNVETLYINNQLVTVGSTSNSIISTNASATVNEANTFIVILADVVKANIQSNGGVAFGNAIVKSANSVNTHELYINGVQFKHDLGDLS